MGLGNKPDWRKEYEWVRLSEWQPTKNQQNILSSARSSRQGFVEDADYFPSARPENVWLPEGGRKVLLVDLDNIRSLSDRWNERMRTLYKICHTADKIIMAGQSASAKLARPHLAEYAQHITQVCFTRSAADNYLVDVGFRLTNNRPPDKKTQFVIVSNDFIFAKLKERGTIVVVSPNPTHISGRLKSVAHTVLSF